MTLRIIRKNTPKMPLHVVTLNPKKFKVDATHTCWVSHSKMGIHS